MRMDRIFNDDVSGIAKEKKQLGQVHPSNEAILESEKIRSLQGMRSFLLSTVESGATRPKNKNDRTQQKAFSQLSRKTFSTHKKKMTSKILAERYDGTAT